MRVMRFVTTVSLAQKMKQRESILLGLPIFAVVIVLFNLRSTSFSLPTSTNHEENPSPREPNLSIFIGIITRPDNYERRHFLRLVYGLQSHPSARIAVRFVFCNLSKPEQRVFVAMETLKFNDVVFLDCEENMNSGKTYAYFSSLPRILQERYDYVMKADDDVFLRLEPLALSLLPLPREDTYYGFVIPCDSQNPFVEYMSGMGFLLSWDIVEWISRSPIPRNDTVGPEDKLVGRWLKRGKKAKNRFSMKPAMYDFPGTNGKCSHDLIPDTIAVHRLKRWDQWFAVLQFFNFTTFALPSI